MDNIKAVFFDFDNTLGNRHRYSYLAYCAFIDEFLPDLKDDLYIEALRQDMEIFDEYGNANLAHVVNSIEKKHGFKINIDNPNSWWIHNLGKYACLYDDTIDTLEQLNKKYRLGIITNGSSYSQRLKIRNCHIEDYFEHIIISEEVGVKKPDKGIFLLTCDLFGLKPEECLYVGDTFSNDIYGALNAGMKAVWMWQDDIKENSYDVPRLMMLHDLLKIL